MTLFIFNLIFFFSLFNEFDVKYYTYNDTKFKFYQVYLKISFFFNMVLVAIAGMADII